MKAIITHYVKLANGDFKYENDKPAFATTEVDFPIKFGYGSYNEPRKVLGPYCIDVDSVISINIKS